MSKTLSYTTAGGVVINARGEILALSRTVMRDGGPVHELRLPKGHIDPGETAEQA
ncbi:MAG: NUDIX hydrolase, partial [Candidatus Hydrogenedentes bacterium]|nr:NUDIX hydrolase [Candidatus Hydrogenedentota bacterium]